MLPIINTPRRYVAVVPIIPENRETYDDAVTYGFADPLQGYDHLQDVGNSADGAGEGYQRELLTEPEGRERLMNPGLTSDIPDGPEGEINLGPGVSGFEQEAEGSYGKFPSILKDELRGGGPEVGDEAFVFQAMVPIGVPSQRNLLDAISHVSQELEQDFNPRDFVLLGVQHIPVRDLPDDTVGWIETEQNSLQFPENVHGYDSFQQDLEDQVSSRSYAHTVNQLKDRRLEPAVILRIDGSEYFADGRGRANMANALGIPLPCAIYEYRPK